MLLPAISTHIRIISTLVDIPARFCLLVEHFSLGADALVRSYGIPALAPMAKRSPRGHQEALVLVHTQFARGIDFVARVAQTPDM